MIRVYIAHPYRGLPENRECATLFYMRAAELGYEPVAPWLIVTAHWGEERRAEGMAINLNAVRACDQIWLCGHEVSPGMRDEESAFVAAKLVDGWAAFARRNVLRFPLLDDVIAGDNQ